MKLKLCHLIKKAIPKFLCYAKNAYLNKRIKKNKIKNAKGSNKKGVEVVP